MTEERNENVVTLGELWRLVLKRIWIVLGAAVLVTVAAVLVFVFALNPLRASYEMNFRIVYPGSMDMKYPDGSPFYYQDMITEEALTVVKESDERFASVDVGEIIENGDIEITFESDKTASEKTYSGQYRISVRMSYFPNKQVATDFIKALARLPEFRINAIADAADYTLDESVFSRASFSAKLDLLAEQKANITEQYNAWNELFGSNYRIRIGETSRTLFSHASEARSAFDEEAKLRLKLEQYDFQSENVEAERVSLAAEYEVNLRKIASLESSKSAPAFVSALAAESDEGGFNVWFPEPELTIDQMIQKLKTRNEDIVTLLGAYNPATKTFDGTGTLATELPAFVSELNRQYAELKEMAETASLVSKALYDQETYTRFESQTAEVEGETSIVLVVLGGFVLGFIAACAVVWLIDYPKYKRAKRAKPAVETDAESEKK